MRVLTGAAALIAGVAAFSAAAAQTPPPPPPPSIRIGTAALLSPSAADAWYGTSTVSSNGLGMAARPNEIIELARALKNDPDQIYKYVRNNVEIVWMYGLQKGALGAQIDRAGTAFDQANLMVELLRQAGYSSASYQAGTITLNGAQFAAWSNITDATAACQLLSSGGIPAVINGTTSADCSGYNHAGITSVQLAHVWVSVAIGGQSYVYDPAYKPHTFKAGLTLSSAAQMTPGDAYTAATTGMSSGTAVSGGASVPYVQNLNATALNAKLQSYGENVLTAIKGLGAPEMEDVVGGGLIDRWEIPAGGLRQTALPYTSAVQHSWSGGVPDQYRTTLRVQLMDHVSAALGDVSVFDSTLFVDEIYGRKLTVNNTWWGYCDASFQAYGYCLRVLDESGQGVTVANVPINTPYDNWQGKLTLTARHPYAASANGTSVPDGTYMRATTTKAVNLTLPLIVVHAWGDSNGLVAKWGHRDDGQAPAVPVVPGPPVTWTVGGNPVCEACQPLSSYAGTIGDGRREELAAAWIEQSSKASRLHAQIAASVFQLHHSIGVISADSQLWAIGSVPGQSAQFIGDSFDVVDMDSSFSLTSRIANAGARRSAVLAIAATSDALEGAIAAQGPDLPDTASTATRFEWGNRPPTTTVDDPSQLGPRKFFAYTGANSAQASALTRIEGALVGTNCGSANDGTSDAYTPTMDCSEIDERKLRMQTAVDSYTGTGFLVSASEEGFLGPGQRAGYMYKVLEGATVYRHYESKQRGGALVATRYDAAGEPVEIAHVVVNFNNTSKGGGGGVQSSHEAAWDPSKAADILKARFVDHSKALGVDLANGALTYTSPARLEVGNGAFPDKLSAELIWRGATQQDPSAGLVTRSEPQAPWTTNWNNSLKMSGSGGQLLGEGDPRALAGTIAAFMVAQDIYASAPSTARDVAAVLTQSWWAHQMSGNVVTVAVGASTKQFVKLIDGSWMDPGSGQPSTLVLTGQRTITTWNGLCHQPKTYALTRGWDNRGLSFQVIGPQGDTQSFSYWGQGVQEDSCTAQLGFHLTSWSFPKGVTVNLTYGVQSGLVHTADQLLSVSNSLGRQIQFINSGLDGFSNGLSGADARAVTVATTQLSGFGWSGTSSYKFTHTDPAGAQTSFVTNGVYWNGHAGGWHLLSQIFTPDNANQPNVQYEYDSMRRVKAAKDAINLQLGTRAPYQFLIADGIRGERVDPADGRFSVEYDPKGRATQFIDELNRMVQVAYDGRMRVIAYTYPEGDREQLVYDDRNNVTFLTRLPKPGSVEAQQNQAIQINAGWNATWNKLATITNPYYVTTVNGLAPTVVPANTPTTTLAYVPSGLGAGEIATATRPAPTAGQPQPVYTFTYDVFGKLGSVTDPTGVVTRNTYAAGSGNLLSTALDPTGVNSVTQYAYYATGEVKSVADPRGKISTVTFDRAGRKIFEIGPDPDAGGPLLRPATKHVYNVAGLEVETDRGTATLDDGSDFQALERASFSYDPAGNKLTATLPTAVGQATPAGLTQYSYDPLNRPLCVAVRMNPAVYGTLPDACTLSTQPSTGSFGPDRIIQNVYDAAGRQTQLIRAFGTSAQQIYATYVYSPNGKQASVADANGNLTAYLFDGFDRPSTTRFPSKVLAAGTADATNYEAYTWDAAGNRLTLRKRDGTVIAFAFDALSREILKDIPNGTSADVYTEYDLAGRVRHVTFGTTTGAGNPAIVTSCTIPGGGIDYCYDSAGRPKSESTGGRTLAFELDAAGNRTQVAWPDASFFVGYTYDALNRLTKMTEKGAVSGQGVLATYAFDDLGRKTTITRGNGTSTSFGYDIADRMIGLAHAMPNSPANDLTLGFIYNPASQLITRTWSNQTYSWLNHPQATTTAAYDGLNRSASVAAASPPACPTTSLPGNAGYDCKGNQLLDDAGVRHFRYDAENRLTCVDPVAETCASGNPRVVLAYDPLGRLRQTQSTNSGVTTTTQYLYEGSRLVAEYDGAGTMLHRYVHGAGVDEPLVDYVGSGTDVRRWLHADRQGSVIAQSDSTGAVVKVFAYGAYGEPQAWGGDSRFAYTGQVQIPEAQIYHYKARAYDPRSGRFLQTDPIGYRDDLDLYAYVGGDPLDRSDPAGLMGRIDYAEEDRWRSAVNHLSASDQAKVMTGIAEKYGSGAAERVAYSQSYGVMYSGGAVRGYVTGGRGNDNQRVASAASSVLGTRRGRALSQEVADKYQPDIGISINYRGVDTTQMDGTVVIDPMHLPKIHTTAGDRYASLERVIAHEFGHNTEIGNLEGSIIDTIENVIMRQLGDRFDRTDHWSEW